MIGRFQISISAERSIVAIAATRDVDALWRVPGKYQKNAPVALCSNALDPATVTRTVLTVRCIRFVLLKWRVSLRLPQRLQP